MDHLATKLVHAPKRRPDIVHLEVRQGMQVTGSFAPLVHSERRGAGRRLPTLALTARSVDEFDTQDSDPEAPGAMRIVGRELDQLQRQAHDQTIRARRM
jgi:hypothetical protein